MVTNHRQELRESCHALALLIGIRPAARKLGINEATACVWSHRFNWQIPDALKALRGPTTKRSPESLLKSNGSVVRETIDETFKEMSEDTRLYLSSAALKASHSAAEKAGNELLGKVESQAVLNTARSADIVHGWTAQRQAAGVNVGVQVNVPLPDPKEREEMKAIDAKLDAIAAKLRE